MIIILSQVQLWGQYLTTLDQFLLFKTILCFQHLFLFKKNSTESLTLGFPFSFQDLFHHGRVTEMGSEWQWVLAEGDDPRAILN